MKFRIANFAWMGGIAVAAFGLYLVKYSVQDVQREVINMRAALVQENKSIHMLNAEWAYLNRPERLKALAEAHMQVAPISSIQILDVQHVQVLPVREEVPAEPLDSLLYPVSDSAVFAPVGGRQ
jgi:hypothetical protein